jgi:hypothetical protein
MSPVVTPEMMQKLINGGESLAKVAAGSASELTSEAVNLFIVDSALSILKFSVVFVIFYIVKRYCDVVMADAEPKNKSMFKAMKTTAFILSLVYFTTQSFPHLQMIAKVLVAPKLFLLEKAQEMTK